MTKESKINVHTFKKCDDYCEYFNGPCKHPKNNFTT